MKKFVLALGLLIIISPSLALGATSLSLSYANNNLTWDLQNLPSDVGYLDVVCSVSYDGISQPVLDSLKKEPYYVQVEGNTFPNNVKNFKPSTDGKATVVCSAGSYSWTATRSIKVNLAVSIASISGIGLDKTSWVGSTNNIVFVRGSDFPTSQSIDQFFEVKVCHPTNASIPCGSFTYAGYCSSKNLCSLTTSNIGPKLSEGNPQLFNSDKKTTMLKVCLKGTANCQSLNFTYEPASTKTLPPTTNYSAEPTVTDVISNRTIWYQGDTNNLIIKYRNFNTKTSQVITYLCHKSGNPCLAIDSAKTPPGQRVYVGTGDGTKSDFSQTIGSKVLSNATLSSYMDATTKESVFKVCPFTIGEGYTTLNPRIGSFSISRNCAYSPAFAIKDYNKGDAPKTSVGCIKGECVCNKGVKRICGNSSASASSCPNTSTNYPNGICNSKQSVINLMLGSTITGFDQLLSAFGLGFKQ